MDLDRIYKLKQEVVMHAFGDQVYVIPVRDNLADMTHILGLNMTAAKIWNELSSGITPDQVIRDLAAEYEAPAVEIRHEMVRFLCEIKDFFEDDTQSGRIQN
jgi:hypothetical protein